MAAADYLDQLIEATNGQVVGAIVRAIGNIGEPTITPTRYARKQTQYGERFVVFYRNEWLWTTALAILYV